MNTSHIIPLCHEITSNPQKGAGHGLGRYALVPKSYAAKDLLEETLCSFYGLDVAQLTSRQRRGFRRFRKHLAYFVEDGIKDPSEPALQDHFELLAKDFDRIFFFGSLCTIHRPIITIQLARQDVLYNPNGVYGAWCKPMTPVSGIPQYQITLAIGATVLHATEDLVLTLVHEMIHAYLLSFVCDQAQCAKDVLNTVGFWSSSHGPTFRALQFAIYSTLRDWGDYFGNYLVNVIPWRLLQKYEVGEEERALRREENQDRRYHLHALRAPDPNDSIRVCGGAVEIDIDRRSARE